ncbi:hypothetical protein [Nocardia sp. NPDC005366]
MTGPLGGYTVIELAGIGPGPFRDTEAVLGVAGWTATGVGSPRASGAVT